jgi:hypothetical protein
MWCASLVPKESPRAGRPQASYMHACYTLSCVCHPSHDLAFVTKSEGEQDCIPSSLNRVWGVQLVVGGLPRDPGCYNGYRRFGTRICPSFMLDVVEDRIDTLPQNVGNRHPANQHSNRLGISCNFSQSAQIKHGVLYLLTMLGSSNSLHIHGNNDLCISFDDIQ